MIQNDKYFLKNGDFIKCFFCGNSLFTSDRRQYTNKIIVFTID